MCGSVGVGVGAWVWQWVQGRVRAWVHTPAASRPLPPLWQVHQCVPFRHVLDSDFLLLVGLAPRGRHAQSEVQSTAKVRKKLAGVGPAIRALGQNYSDPRSYIYREIANKPLAVIITGLATPMPRRL